MVNMAGFSEAEVCAVFTSQGMGLTDDRETAPFVVKKKLAWRHQGLFKGRVPLGIRKVNPWLQNCITASCELLNFLAPGSTFTGNGNVGLQNEEKKEI